MYGLHGHYPYTVVMYDLTTRRSKTKSALVASVPVFLITPLPNLPPLRAYPLLNAPTSSVPLSGHGLFTLAPVVGGLCSCLSIRYYQPYFDVDTQHVVDRIKYALFPFKKESTFIQVRT